MLFVSAHQMSAPASELSWTFAFVQGELLVPEDSIDAFGPVRLEAWVTRSSASHYLGSLSEVDCWALDLAEAPPGWRPASLRTAMMALDPTLAAIAGRAAQVLEWDRTHRYCGACGSGTAIQPGERARVCSGCGHTAYPRLSPAIMALVWRPGELLLARSPGFTPGRYSALAGFVEAGESLEECLHREVAEEVGVAVSDLRYYGSQSWPFPHSLMVAFTARWVSGDIVPQAGEIEDARWFPLDALPDIPPRFSIAGHLIRDAIASPAQ
jgi:NAD+ diphosphatase